MAEATGIGSASSILPEGRSRIPFPDLRTEPSTNPRWPLRGDASARPQYGTRARRLTPEQEAEVRGLADTKSLWSLAAEFRVSQETTRTGADNPGITALSGTGTIRRQAEKW